jgi:hypothetical protein
LYYSPTGHPGSVKSLLRRATSPLTPSRCQGVVALKHFSFNRGNFPSISGATSMKLLIALISLALTMSAQASCRNPAPSLLPFEVPSGQSCPSGYSQSGNLCNPGGSARFSFVVPQGQSCPSNFSQSGRVCNASSTACHAFVIGSGSCPSGYSQSGMVCSSN